MRSFVIETLAITLSNCMIYDLLLKVVHPYVSALFSALFVYPVKCCCLELQSPALNESQRHCHVST